MSHKTYMVEITETYTARVLVNAESKDHAQEIVDNLVNNDTIDPVKLSMKQKGYSRDCNVIQVIKSEDALPCGVEFVG